MVNIYKCAGDTTQYERIDRPMTSILLYEPVIVLAYRGCHSIEIALRFILYIVSLTPVFRSLVNKQVLKNIQRIVFDHMRDHGQPQAYT